MCSTGVPFCIFVASVPLWLSKRFEQFLEQHHAASAKLGHTRMGTLRL